MKANCILVAWMVVVGIGSGLIMVAVVQDLALVDLSTSRSPPWSCIAPYLDSRSVWFVLGALWTLMTALILAGTEKLGSLMEEAGSMDSTEKEIQLQGFTRSNSGGESHQKHHLIIELRLDEQLANRTKW